MSPRVGLQIGAVQVLGRRGQVADRGEAVQRPVVGEKVVVQLGSALGVGEHGHGEVAIGHHEEPRVLTRPGSAVLDDRHVLPVTTSIIRPATTKPALL